MIEGFFDGAGRPRVEGFLSLPRLGISRSIRFLLDTGADITAINLGDANTIGIPYDLLESDSQSPATGAGGQAHFYQERGTISFQDGSMFSGYIIPVRIEAGKGLSSSVLGRNIIDRWHIEYDPQVDILRCTPRTADYELP